LGSLFFLFRAEISSIPIVKLNLYVANVYLDGGLKNFKESNGVWGTYVTRVSAIEGSIRCIGEHPLGIGFGSYNSWFRVNMAHSGIDNPEVNAVLSGEKYASSKSNLLELFVATGIFGIFLWFYIGKYIFKYRKEHSYIFKSFIMLTLASLFIELNPMFTYLTILWVMLEKEQHNNTAEVS
jgi:glycosyltransferase involved in cell wall biosynthesis